MFSGLGVCGRLTLAEADRFFLITALDGPGEQSQIFVGPWD